MCSAVLYHMSGHFLNVSDHFLKSTNDTIRHQARLNQTTHTSGSIASILDLALLQCSMRRSISGVT